MAVAEDTRLRGPRVRRDHDRFVGFAFASATLMVESDPDGIISYAAGAFSAEFGRPPEHFVGRPLHDLVAPSDREAVQGGLLLLGQRGRLLPMTVRLANARRTPLALAGLMLPGDGASASLCLSFAPLPSPLGASVATGRSFGLAAEAALRAGRGVPGDLRLIEVCASHGEVLPAAAFGAALQSIAPNVMAGEIGPGRFGLLDEGGGLLQIATMLEEALRGEGMAVQVASSELSLSRDGLSVSQAVRALRRALMVFAQDGEPGLSGAGFARGLAGYLQDASVHVNALRRSVWAGRFELAFQPIVSFADRSPHHYEALIRPEPIAECPFAGPQEFILLVEALGLAEEVDLVIAHRACDAAEAAGLTVAFNISGQSAESASFRRRLIDLLGSHRAARAGRIGVELTETADIEHVDEVGQMVAALREIGVKFCLDDFGSGVADVRLLRALGADIVKIDGSYIPGAVEHGRERAFVGGMIDIARGAGAVVVAERIETEAEAEAMQSLGAEYGQGWAFGRPEALPAKGADAKQGRRRVGG